MNRFLILTTIIILCNMFLCTSQELTKASILKDGTVLTYSVNELTKQNGFSGVRIVEGSPLGEEVKITLTQTDSGLKPMVINADGVKVFGDVIDNKTATKTLSYKNFVDVSFSQPKATSVFLPQSLFNKPSITIFPEWEKESYLYQKSKANSPFTFKLNASTVESTVDYYTIKESDKTIATTFAFLCEEKLPIQTHLYYEYNGKDEHGIFFKLVSIETK